MDWKILSIAYTKFSIFGLTTILVDDGLIIIIRSLPERPKGKLCVKEPLAQVTCDLVLLKGGKAVS